MRLILAGKRFSYILSAYHRAIICMHAKFVRLYRPAATVEIYCPRDHSSMIELQQSVASTRMILALIHSE